MDLKTNRSVWRKVGWQVFAAKSLVNRKRGEGSQVRARQFFFLSATEGQTSATNQAVFRSVKMLLILAVNQFPTVHRWKVIAGCLTQNAR